jgi:hypothetical protein
MRGALYLHDTTRGSKDDPHHAVDHPSEGAPLLVLRARQRDIEHVDVFLGSLRRRVHGLVGQICGAVNIGTTAAVLWSAACLRQTTTAWHINSDRERGERVLEVRGRPPPPHATHHSQMKSGGLAAEARLALILAMASLEKRKAE